MTRHHRHSRAIAAAAAIGLALSGCSLLGPQPAPTVPNAGQSESRPAPAANSPVAAMTWAAELLPAGDYVHEVAVIAESGGHPSLLVAHVSNKGSAKRLTAWAVGGDAGWQPVQLPMPPGGVTSWVAQGNQEASVIAGVGVSGDGVPYEFALHSTDRIAWQDMELPPELTGHEIEALALDGARIALLAADVETQALVAVLDGAHWRVLAMPRGETARLWRSVEVDGDDVAVLATGSSYGEREHAVYHASLETGHVTANAVAGEVPGAVPVAVHKAADGWLVIGASRSKLGYLVPTSWRSTDAQTWAWQEINQIDGTWLQPAMFSAPEESNIQFTDSWVTEDGTVLAAATADLGSDALGLVRGADGRWRSAGGPAPLPWITGTARAVTLGGEPTLVTLAAGRAQVRRLGEAAAEFELGAVTAPHEWLRLTDGIAIAGWREMSVTKSGASLEYKHRGIALTGGQVEAYPGLPPAPGTPWLALGFAKDGSQVAATLSLEGTAHQVDTWHRDSGGQWQRGDVLSVPAGASEPVIGHFGNQWHLATGEVTERGTQLRMWLSADGRSWRDAGLDAAPAAAAAWAGLCDLGDGSAIALGHASGSDGLDWPHAWLVSDGAPARIGLNEGQQTYSMSLHSCAGWDGAAWAIGGDKRSVYRIGTDGSIEQILQMARGSRMDRIVATHSGVAISGFAWSQQFRGHAVWVSADGRDFQPTTLPGSANGPGAEVHLSVDGEDLLALAAAAGTPQAWRISTPWQRLGAAPASAG